MVIIDDFDKQNFDTEKVLFCSISDWQDWLDMKLDLYSQAAIIKSSLQKASEDDRIFHGICLRIFNEIKDKLLSQMRLSPSEDVFYLFSAACESLKKEIPFPYGFVLSDCAYALDQLKARHLARRSEVKAALGEDSLTS